MRKNNKKKRKEIVAATDILHKMLFENMAKNLVSDPAFRERLKFVIPTINEIKRTSSGFNTIPPPLGLIPKWIRWEHRKREIEHAIIRYVGCNTPVPLEWFVELNEICEYLNKRENG